MNDRVAYKVVRRLEDGTLVSSFVDRDKIWCYHNSQLTYEYGKITMQGEDSEAGIFCHRILETAIHSRGDVSTSVPHTAEVHEVFPIGEEISFWKTVPALVNYPAVLFGRKVANVEG